MVTAGILLLLSPLSSNAMAKAKDRLAGAASGFLILALTYLIVITINPQLNAFKMQPPPKEPNLCPNGVKNPDGTITCPPTKLPGVYFYQGTNCKGDTTGSSTNIPDFNAFVTKAIRSAGIEHDDQNNIYYISLVYSQKNFFGACQYITPNYPCADIEIPVINSANIYAYGQEPNGSVIFYRNASVNENAGDFNKEGGFVELTESDIGRLYEGKLSNLKFVGSASNKNSSNIEDCTVPKDKQDCKMWDKDGKCKEGKKECPNLTGENISAIEIKGNYLVVLEYVSKDNMTASGDPGEVADFCQAYPSAEDVNKYGPKQVKWDAIRNNINFYPNYVLIIPLQEL